MIKISPNIISIVIFLISLTGCNIVNHYRVETAIEIIKKNLESPSSFSLISGETVWSGKDSNEKAAYIVRVEYDAQNVFGAIIRNCQLVAFPINDGKYKPAYRSFGECEVKTLYNETQMIGSLRLFNFPKSKP